MSARREAAEEVFADLVDRRPGVYLAKLAVWALFIAGGLALLVSTDLPVAVQLLGGVLFAAMVVHGIELQHQALHGTATHWRAFDRWVGFVLGWPLLISFSHYRDRHLHHHQHAGTSDDSEFFQYSKEDNGRIARFIANVLMIPHWRRVGRLMYQAWTGRPMGRIYNRNNAAGIRSEYRLFAIGTALFVALCMADPAMGGRIVAALCLAAALHTLIELPEHWGCAKSPDVFRNTRSISSSWFMTWLTNGNNYHVEHHLAPALRPEQLVNLHRRIYPLIEFRNSSYIQFLRQIAWRTSDARNR